MYIEKINPIPECPECHNTNLKQISNDNPTVYCKKCGLILNGENYHINRTKVHANNQKYQVKRLKYDPLTQ